MHLWRTLLAAGLLVTCACAASTIYKWTDAAGVIHYADQPVPGAQKITVDVDVVHTPAASRAAPAPAPGSPGPQAPVPYTHFLIDSPTGEQSFFSEPVPVHLTMQPGLQPGHTLAWSLNGKPLDQHANQQQFTLPDLPRGAFTLSATVVDSATDQTLNSASVTFYVHRPSLLNPHHHPR